MAKYRMTTETPILLTEEETAIVLAHRAQKAAEVARVAYLQKVADHTAKFYAWSQREGQGLTFSTFVNTYGYDEPDSRRVFEAVCSMLNPLETEVSDPAAN